VYISQEVDGEFKIQLAKTSDGGDSWSFIDLTTVSGDKDVRPIAIDNRNTEV